MGAVARSRNGLGCALADSPYQKLVDSTLRGPSECASSQGQRPKGHLSARVAGGASLPTHGAAFSKPFATETLLGFLWPLLLQFISWTKKTGTLGFKYCPNPGKGSLSRPERSPAETWRVPPTSPLGWGGNPEVGLKPNPKVVAAPAASQGMLSGQNRFSGLEIGSFCTTHPHSSSNYLSQTRGPLVPGRKSHTPNCCFIGYRQGFTSLDCFIG